jgi:arabinoxylan arabinofuranohydrolase
MNKITSLALVAATFGLSLAAHAVNPVVQTIYTADPAPVVHDGTLYLFTSHDEDELVKNFFTMKDWRCYSTTDMVNWTDHGAVASMHDLKWAGSGWGGGFENGAWAPQAIVRDGKWYLYVPLQGRGIGVLVADNPFGPFTDPIGKPLIPNDNIDPAVFIDDDGQGYLYWGNPKCWYVKLNKDMISFDTSIGDKGLVVLDMTVEQFNKRRKDDPKRPTTYEEGPWLYKRNGLYYLFFAGGPIPEHLGYSTSPSAEGPWKYGGVVMEPQSAFTIHPGVVDYKGKTYMFYHNAGLPGGGGFHRSVCVDEMEFNSDGTVKKMTPTKEGPAAIGTLNPYERVEAETIAWEYGIETKPAGDKAGNMVVTNIDDGDHVEVKNVDFGSPGARTFAACVASDKKTKAAIELHLDSADGQLVGTLPVGDTAGKWKTVTTNVTGARGVHDLVLVFKGDPAGDLFKLDWWKLGR